MSDPLETHLLDQTDRDTSFFWHRLRWRYVAGHLPAGPFTLLDIGAGTGVTGKFLRTDRPDARYTFDEPIASLRRRLRRDFGADADLHDTGPVPAIDVVTLLDVLEHVEHDRAFLASVVARLQPGTTIIITVPADMRLWSRWDELLGHHRRYDLQGLQELADSVPVDVLEKRWLFPEMLPAAWWRARRDRPGTIAADVSAAHATGAEFPHLPGVVNRALYVGGILGHWASRWTRFGTSVAAVLRTRSG